MGSDGLGSIEKLKEPVSLAIKSLNLYDRADFASFSKEVQVKGEIEIVNQISGWDFVKINGVTGYLATEEAKKEKEETEKKKNNLLAEDEPLPKKKKGFLGGLFS